MFSREKIKLRVEMEVFGFVTKNEAGIVTHSFIRAEQNFGKFKFYTKFKATSFNTFSRVK
jgi:hypothetical protein